MTEIKQGETQQEFFPGFPKAGKGAGRPLYESKLQRPILITTSIEQVILAGILLILIACFVFFLGVVRGKALGAAKQQVVSVMDRKTMASKIEPASVPALLPSRSITAAGDHPRTAILVQAASSGLRHVGRDSGMSRALQDPNKPYTIQLVTYKKQDLAEKETANLRRSGYFSLIVPNGEFFEVRAGQYASKEEAKKDLKFFTSRYPGCYLRRR